MCPCISILHLHLPIVFIYVYLFFTFVWPSSFHGVWRILFSYMIILENQGLGSSKLHALVALIYFVIILGVSFVLSVSACAVHKLAAGHYTCTYEFLISSHDWSLETPHWVSFLNFRDSIRNFLTYVGELSRTKYKYGILIIVIFHKNAVCIQYR